MSEVKQGATPVAAMPLAELIAELEQALTDNNWAQIAILDSILQTSVETAITAQSKPSDPSNRSVNPQRQLQPQLERLSSLYEQLQQRCAGERDKVGAQINNVATGRSGIKQYSDTSTL